MNAAAQIVIDRVSHVYRPPRGRPVTALDSISLEVSDREFVALLGPSGCGKSTLLYLVGGFLPVEHGVIRVEDQPVTGPNQRPLLSGEVIRRFIIVRTWNLEVKLPEATLHLVVSESRPLKDDDRLARLGIVGSSSRAVGR